jgi:hypothetical protein
MISRPGLPRQLDKSKTLSLDDMACARPWRRHTRSSLLSERRECCHLREPHHKRVITVSCAVASLAYASGFKRAGQY